MTKWLDPDLTDGPSRDDLPRTGPTTWSPIDTDALLEAAGVDVSDPDDDDGRSA